MYLSPSQKIQKQLKDLKNKVTCGVQFFDIFSDFPETGKECAVYVDKSTGTFYVWNGTSYITCCGGDGAASLLYGSFYDVTDQSVTSGQVAPMEFGVTDFSSGVSITNDLSSNPTMITLSADGVYNIQFSAQLYRTSGGSGAHARIWLRKNGTNVPDTNTVVHFGNNNVYSVAAWNFFAQASAGDKYQIMWTQDDAITIAYEPENLVVPYPAVPSTILTVNQIA